MTRSGPAEDGSQFYDSRGPGLVADLDEIFARRRRDYAAILDIIADLDHDQIARKAGYPNLRTMLVHKLRISPGEASKMIAQSAQVAETLTPTGHTAPAPLPLMREALHEGLVDGDHIDAVAKVIKELPTTTSLQDRELVEATLAATARTADPHVVRDQGRELLARLDQDGTQPGDEERQAEPINRLSFRLGHDGRMTFRGDIEPEAAELMGQLLGDLSKPQPPADGIPDPRSKQQRLGDAFTEIVHRAANPSGAAKARLVVTMDINVLLDGIGTATLDSGCILSPSAVRRLACDAQLIPMVLNGKSVPLDVGRTHRLVRPAQRDALIARDRGCAFPGCCNPARWADAHHIRHWLDGGKTDLDNLVLLCRRHHRLLHHSEWTVTLTGGIPYFRPPKWLDPDQKPIRNILHHPRP